MNGGLKSLHRYIRQDMTRGIVPGKGWHQVKGRLMSSSVRSNKARVDNRSQKARVDNRMMMPPVVPRDVRRPRADFATMPAMAALLCLSYRLLAGPTGGTVVAGTAAIQQSGTVTNVN